MNVLFMYMRAIALYNVQCVYNVLTELYTYLHVYLVLQLSTRMSIILLSNDIYSMYIGHLDLPIPLPAVAPHG